MTSYNVTNGSGNLTFESINGGLKMTALSKSLAGAVIGAGILAFSAVSASAGIACVGLVCWHVQDTYEYPSESRVVVHKDDWKWGPSEKYSWREHEGRGYWLSLIHISEPTRLGMISY